MNYNRQKYSAGIMLNEVESIAFKSNFLQISFYLPMKEESMAYISLLARVLKRGTKSYPTSDAIHRRTEELYAGALFTDVAKVGEEVVFRIGIDMLDDRFSYDNTEITQGMLTLLFEAITEPATENGLFRSEDVTKEKETLAVAIASAINNKTTYAIDRCREIMFEGTPYAIGRYGRTDQIALLTPESLTAFYKNMLKTADIEVSYGGNPSQKAIAEQTAKRLSSYQEKIELAVTRPSFVTPVVKSITEQMDSVQGKLTLGFRFEDLTPEEKFFAMPLFLTLFSKSPTSKLFVEVREKKSLCYYCSSVYAPEKGVMYVYAGIENKNVSIAQDAILEQFSAMQQGKITDEEMQSAKNSIQNQYRTIKDSLFAVESFYRTQNRSGVSASIEDCLKQILQMSAIDIQNIARKIHLDTVYFMQGTELEEGEDNA